VPLVLFVVMQFLGKRTIPHWFNLAWLFAFPLLGGWLSAKPVAWLCEEKALSNSKGFTWTAKGPPFSVDPGIALDGVAIHGSLYKRNIPSLTS
jgi:hypothetical protein